jgi:hypothetical protein
MPWTGPGRDARPIPPEARVRRREVSEAATVVVVEEGAVRDRAVRRDHSFVDSVVERLHAEYGVDREQIRSRAAEVLARFATAPVQAFVPILVEKALRQTYRASSRAVALW